MSKKVARKRTSKARGGSANSRKPAGSVASEATADNAAQKPSATLTLRGDIGTRLDEIDRNSVLMIAVRNAESSSRGNANSGVWKLSIRTIHLMAQAHILDGWSGAEVCRHFESEINAAKIDERVVSRWLKKIRTAYDKAYNAHVMRVGEHDAAMFQSGDMLTLTQYVAARLIPRMLTIADTSLSKDATPGDFGPFLRLLEIMISAGKVQAEARLKEVQRDRILGMFKTEIEKVKGGTRSPEEALALIAGVVQREMLGTGGEAA